MARLHSGGDVNGTRFAGNAATNGGSLALEASVAVFLHSNEFNGEHVRCCSPCGPRPVQPAFLKWLQGSSLGCPLAASAAHYYIVVHATYTL